MRSHTLTRRCLVEAVEPRQLLTTFYVDNNAGITTRNGTSWNSAYADLQLALNAASSGDTIRVADGTYKPTATTTASISFALKGGVSLLGGHAGFGAPDPDARSFVTTLSGDVNPNLGQDSYHVVSASLVDATTVLDGFTITGGRATTGTPRLGGGLYCF